ncbi:MAG: class I SAM-dependent methyltransferase [Nostoc sp. CmiVER01]|uniref:class I SAM-dependent methyltransferase n=1 Tax=Nostoc sp. CmiVER01 TaxID=3075384 RepID=UPI002AD3B7B7|nr:class I SAM-dependent methyltransferase [Nostoc sp. CmiVER01]MDZ8123792.1 class I SAM-dependent methyltransferase [Nostoc sp. CmiVER01]
MAITDYHLDNERIVGYYSNLIHKYKFDAKALDWGNQKSQELRFSILTQIGQLDGTSVLDVGCGLADLLGYLQRCGISLDYTGYDITPAMIDFAHQRFPHAHLEIRDLMANFNPLPQFDYVLASGIFYLRQVEPMAYLESMIRRMFSLCRRGVAFNTLSCFASEQNPNEFYADPVQMLAMSLKITRYVVIRHDYLPHDFTVYLYKEER